MDVGRGRTVSVGDCRVASGREGGALSMLEGGGEAREGGEVREGGCGVGEWREEESVMGSGGGECVEVEELSETTEEEVTWGGLESVVSEGGETDEDETGPDGATAISPGRFTGTLKGFESFSASVGPASV